MSTCVDHGVDPLAAGHDDRLALDQDDRLALHHDDPLALDQDDRLALDQDDPLALDRDDPGVAVLQTAFLRARVRDTTVRLSLAMFQAREYGQVWGRDDEARRWAATAGQLRVELDALDARLAAADALLPPGGLPPAA